MVVAGARCGNRAALTWSHVKDRSMRRRASVACRLPAAHTSALTSQLALSGGGVQTEEGPSVSETYSNCLATHCATRRP